jgi:hypothetical protein
MCQPVETFVLNNKTVEIYLDEDPQNPRENDNADTMVCFHGRYNLGDKHNYRSSDFSGWDAIEKQIIEDHNPVAIFPLYMLDHSGLTLSTSAFSCPWDSGQIGFVFISREVALKENHSKRVTNKIKEWAERYIKASVEEYDQYLRGDVYGYVIKDEEGNQEDSCWGFFGFEAVKEAVPA